MLYAVVPQASLCLIFRIMEWRRSPKNILKTALGRGEQARL